MGRRRRCKRKPSKTNKQRNEESSKLLREMPTSSREQLSTDGPMDECEGNRRRIKEATTVNDSKMQHLGEENQGLNQESKDNENFPQEIPSLLLNCTREVEQTFVVDECIKQLKSMISQNKEELLLLQRNSRSLVYETSTQKRKIEEAKSRENLSRDQIIQMKKQIEDKQRKIELIQKENEVLGSECRTLVSDNYQLNRSNSAISQNNKNMEAEIKKLKEKKLQN